MLKDDMTLIGERLAQYHLETGTSMVFNLRLIDQSLYYELRIASLENQQFQFRTGAAIIQWLDDILTDETGAGQLAIQRQRLNTLRDKQAELDAEVDELELAVNPPR